VLNVVEVNCVLNIKFINIVVMNATATQYANIKNAKNGVKNANICIFVITKTERQLVKNVKKKKHVRMKKR